MVQKLRPVSTHPLIGVGAIVQREGRILMVRRADAHGAGSWSTPGGYLDLGEAPEICAARETQEETGVEAINFQLFAVTNDIFGENRHFVTLWLTGMWRAGEAHVQAADEVSAVGWYPWNSMPHPRFLSFENLV